MSLTPKKQKQKDNFDKKVKNYLKKQYMLWGKFNLGDAETDPTYDEWYIMDEDVEDENHIIYHLTEFDNNETASVLLNYIIWMGYIECNKDEDFAKFTPKFMAEVMNG